MEIASFDWREEVTGFVYGQGVVGKLIVCVCVCLSKRVIDHCVCNEDPWSQSSCLPSTASMYVGLS
jgi:hypothetical protein